MINFDTELDQLGVTRLVVTDAIPEVTESITIRRPEVKTTFVSKDTSDWTWQDLQRYVVTQIESLFGMFPRDTMKEIGIFKGFLTRWGVQAGQIAQFAFEECRGMWKGSPVGVSRFCANCDPYFATPIAERIKV